MDLAEQLAARHGDDALLEQLQDRCATSEVTVITGTRTEQAVSLAKVFGYGAFPFILGAALEGFSPLLGTVAKLAGVILAPAVVPSVGKADGERIVSPVASPCPTANPIPLRLDLALSQPGAPVTESVAGRTH